MLAVASLVLSACGAEAQAPAAPPPDLLEGMEAAAPTQLDIADLADDAADPRPLAALLEEAGFEAAVERSFSGGAAEIRRVDVWIVRFSTPDGADRYATWLGAHAGDVIGGAELLGSMAEPPGASILLHEPSGCCPKETNVVLTTWQEGSVAIRVVVAGPGASKATATPVAVAVYRWREQVR